MLVLVFAVFVIVVMAAPVLVEAVSDATHGWDDILETLKQQIRDIMEEIDAHSAARELAIAEGNYLLADELQGLIDLLKLQIDDLLNQINLRLQLLGFPSWIGPSFDFNGEA